MDVPISAARAPARISSLDVAPGSDTEGRPFLYALESDAPTGTSSLVCPESGLGWIGVRWSMICTQMCLCSLWK